MKENIIEYLRPKTELSPLPTGLKCGGTALTGIRAFIFDIYGTMLISGSGDVGTVSENEKDSISRQAFGKALSAAGIDDPDADRAGELYRRLIAEAHAGLKAVGVLQPEIEIREIWTKIIADAGGAISEPGSAHPGELPETAAVVYESAVNPVWPMPGLGQLLKALREGRAFLGIISNAQFYTPLLFDSIYARGLEGLGFKPGNCIFSYRHRRAKPDLSLFSEMNLRLAEAGIRPSEAVYIGNDMLNDVSAAAAAGYRTVLFAGDARSLRLREGHPACKDVKPDVIVNNLISILDYVQEG